MCIVLGILCRRLNNNINKLAMSDNLSITISKLLHCEYKHIYMYLLNILSTRCHVLFQLNIDMYQLQCSCGCTVCPHRRWCTYAHAGTPTPMRALSIHLQLWVLIQTNVGVAQQPPLVGVKLEAVVLDPTQLGGASVVEQQIGQERARLHFRYVVAVLRTCTRAVHKKKRLRSLFRYMYIIFYSCCGI